MRSPCKRARLALAAPLAFSLAACGQELTAPYPASEHLLEATWAPANTTIALAYDSDNWPTTWSAGGDLITAYGDGHGFRPGTAEKLSLGLGRVTGMPPDISGENIYPTEADALGYGPTGRKASGLIAVDTDLYMWVRNANGDGTGCQLGKSQDGGKSWRWADWGFDQFGYCTFLNFGQANADARDDFVYTYSNDNPSAYRNADQFILMRAPRDQLLEESAYEYFAGLDATTPIWSRDRNDRRSVFTHKNRCRRSGVSFNQPLGRYLWWQQHSDANADDRFEPGGFGVYEAPTPWGPWRTVFYTTKWDMPVGDTGHFPTKWMSPDGQTMHLVFSANDQFTVRALTVRIPGKSGTPQ